jgi:hypothetical protein
MSTLAIEINDAELAIAGGDVLLASEPGYALVEDNVVLTGWEAYRQARLKPQRVSNRYWSSISTEPDAEGGLGGASPAELAYAHIDKLWKAYGTGESDAILIVPEHFAPQQLGLVLGLAQESGIDVRAMINSAVAGALRPFPGRQLVYVDAGLHRVSVTTIGQTGEATLSDTQALESTGLAALMDAFARRVAEKFVLTTRFDPLHEAASEQLLYDRLAQWLDALASAATVVAQLPFGDDEFAVEIEREQVLGAAAGFYRAVVQLIAQSRDSGSRIVVQLSHRLASLPGFAAELARLDDAEIVPLERGHAALAALRRAAAIERSGTAVKLLRHLPWHEEPADASPLVERSTVAELVPATRHAPVPTHIVYQGIAHSVTDGELVIGRARIDDQRTIVLGREHSGVSRSHCSIYIRDGELWLKDLSRYGTFVNEKRVPGETTLRPADVIRIGSPGAELEAIAIGKHDGA